MLSQKIGLSYWLAVDKKSGSPSGLCTSKMCLCASWTAAFFVYRETGPMLAFNISFANATLIGQPIIDNAFQQRQRSSKYRGYVISVSIVI